MKTLLLFLALMLVTTHAAVGVEVLLRADESPTKKPWEKGASFGYSHNSKGSSTIVDADTRLAFDLGNPATSLGVFKPSLTVGGYVHRDTTADKPKNDRGISGSYTCLFIPNARNDGPVWDLSMLASIKDGKTLKLETINGVKEKFDVNSQREIVTGAVYFQPRKSGTPDPTPFSLKNHVIFCTAEGGGYQDKTAGASEATVNGRIKGLLGKVTVTIAPFGIDAPTNQLKVLSVGVVPLISAAAQGQWDSGATGGRKEENRELYSYSLTLQFGTLAGTKRVIPGITFSRSKGADVLAGQQKDDVKKLAFTLLF